jgi:hypothetical protein
MHRVRWEIKEITEFIIKREAELKDLGISLLAM